MWHEFWRRSFDGDENSGKNEKRVENIGSAHDGSDRLDVNRMKREYQGGPKSFPDGKEFPVNFERQKTIYGVQQDIDKVKLENVLAGNFPLNPKC